MSLVEEIVKTINATKVAEVVKVNDGGTSLQITHRVKSKELKVWLGIITYVLSRKQGWDAHVCKHYFLRRGKLLYAWNLIAQWGDPGEKPGILAQLQLLIRKANQEVPRVVHALESYPLAGAKEGRNEPEAPMNFRSSGPMMGGPRQKGAHKIKGG
jgi:hypothetical protein